MASSATVRVRTQQVFTLPQGGRHRVVRLPSEPPESYEEALNRGSLSAQRSHKFDWDLFSRLNTRPREVARPRELTFVNFGIGAITQGRYALEWGLRNEFKDTYIEDVCDAIGELPDLREIFGEQTTGVVATATWKFRRASAYQPPPRDHVCYVRRHNRQQYVGHNVIDRPWEGSIWWFAFASSS